MRDPIRIIVLGTGQMGSGIARLALAKQGLHLAGVYARRPGRAGIDVGRAVGLERDLGIVIDTDLAALVERTRPAVAIQATCSRLEDAWPEVSLLLRHGVRVISIAEEMAYPAFSSPAMAEDLHNLALANGVAIVGTGINPGFVLDLLVIVLTGACAQIEAITASRANDLSPYGPSVLSAQGVGLTPECFDEGVKNGAVVGHVGFPQSIHMIATAVGWEIDRIVENREPIVSQVRRETPFVAVEPGRVAGCRHTAVAYRGDKAVITLIHPQQIQPHLEGVDTGDTVEIAGTPSIKLAGSPEIPGGTGTTAIAVNMIPRILSAAPGLHTMADLPVPAAMLADARRFVHAPGRHA